MELLTLYGDVKDVQTMEILCVGKLVGVNIKTQQTKEGEKINNENVKEDCVLKNMYPILDAKNGHIISGNIPILRFLADRAPQLELLGSTYSDKTRVDAILHMYSTQLEQIYYTHTTGKNADLTTAEKELKKLCSCLNEYLLKQTYLAGENITIADICVCTIISVICKSAINNLDIPKNYQNLFRLVQTVCQQPVFNNILEFARKSESCDSSSKKPAETSVVEPEDEEVTASKELDALPNGDFVLDAWKREYSNSKDIQNEAMKYFWKNYEKDFWSIYSIAYNKLPDECTIQFVTLNQLNGFVQRMHAALRKHGFGVFAIVGEDKDFDIKGVLMFPGKEMPRAMTIHPSYEFHTFRKLDIDDNADRQLITDYFVSVKNPNMMLEGKPVVHTICFK